MHPRALLPFLLLSLPALAEDPTFAARALELSAHYEHREFPECIAAATGLSTAPEWTRPELALYTGACCAALAAKRDEAFAFLTKLVPVAGTSMLADTRTDDDLATLRTDPRWMKHLAAVQAKERANPLDARLKKIVDADQADRQGPYSPAIATRDAARRREVDQLLSRGAANSSRDYLAAALVFQHGDDDASFERANALARKAVELEATCAARRMVALTEDRRLTHRGQPQKFGTQYTCTGQGPCTRAPVDPTVTDAARAALCVAPLAEQAETM